MPSAQTDTPVFAARGNRAAAFLLDLMLLLVIASFASGMPFAGMPAFALLVLLYLWLMPLTPLQGTLGKWICRIRLADRAGARLNLRNAGVRAFAFTAWCAIAVFIIGNRTPGAVSEIVRNGVWFVFPLPWATLGFLPRRESLFDLLAGTVVVRAGSDAATVAGAAPARKPRVLNIGTTVIVIVLFGAIMSVQFSVMHDRELRGRIGYAMVSTDTLKQNIAAFHARERRWPTPAELGIAEWTPYPDGGGYRLQKDGSIAINFTVIPELKELVITYRPVPYSDGGRIEWTCTSAPPKAARYVPATCRTR